MFFILVLFLSFECLAEENVNTLVQSELAFARTASEKGIKTAFLMYLAEDSILFRPRVVSGREWMQGRPETPGALIWEPSYAEVSGAGDLGFTTGPYIYKPSANEPPATYGQFFSIWKKQPDQTWKVLLDAGIEYDKEKPKASLITRTGHGTQASEGEREKQRDTVRAKDVALLPDSLAPDAIVLRDKDFNSDCTFSQEASAISQSADLAYVFGTFTCGESKGVYVRVWRKEDGWKVAVDYRKSDR